MKWDLAIKTIRLVLTGLHKHRFRRILILAAEENLRLFPRSGKRTMTDFRKMPCANGAPPFSYRNMKTCFVWFIWYLTLGKKSKEAQHPLFSRFPSRPLFAPFPLSVSPQSPNIKHIAPWKQSFVLGASLGFPVIATDKVIHTELWTMHHLTIAKNENVSAEKISSGRMSVLRSCMRRGRVCLFGYLTKRAIILPLLNANKNSFLALV